MCSKYEPKNLKKLVNRTQFSSECRAQWVLCQHSGCSASTVGALPAQWALCQHNGCSANTVGALPTQWALCQHSGRSASTVRAHAHAHAHANE